MIPQLTAIGHLIQLCNSDAVFLGWNMLGLNVHGDFAEIKVCPDAGRGSDAILVGQDGMLVIELRADIAELRETLANLSSSP